MIEKIKFRRCLIIGLSSYETWEIGFLAKRFIQHVINFVHAQFFLEAADCSILVDMYHFDTCDFSIIFPIFRSQVVRETWVVSTTCQNPSTRTYLEAWHRNPKGRRNRQLRQRLRFDTFHIVYDQTETIPQIYDSSRTTRTYFWGEDQTYRLALTIPIPKKCTSRRGLDAAIRGQISNICDWRIELWPPLKFKV